MLLSQALFHIQAEILLFDLTLITAPERVMRALETIQPLTRAYTQQIEQTRHAPPSPDFILRERRQCGKPTVAEISPRPFLQNKNILFVFGISIHLFLRCLVCKMKPQNSSKVAEQKFISNKQCQENPVNKSEIHDVNMY